MKLPFAFGINLVFRLVLPGLVLALVIVFQVPELAVIPELGEGATIGMLTVFIGWLITLADMPIYMLFEGRRFWPAGLRRRMRRREQARLRRLQTEADAYWSRARALQEKLDAEPPPAGTARDELALEHSEAVERHLERAIQASRFPLDERGERHASMPTRLGNLIYEYEHYPATKYGLDSVFFFYRLWLLVDNDMREEIDGKQAVVDGATYVAFAAVIGAVLCLGAAVADLIRLVAEAPAPLQQNLEALAVNLALAFGLSVLAYLVYRLSIYAHLQFGEIYKALFDQHWHSLDLDPTLHLIECKTGRPSPPRTNRPERARTAWRYLRWHRVRVDGANVNVEQLDRAS